MSLGLTWVCLDMVHLVEIFRDEKLLPNTWFGFSPQTNENKKVSILSHTTTDPLSCPMKIRLLSWWYDMHEQGAGGDRRAGVNRNRTFMYV